MRRELHKLVQVRLVHGFPRGRPNRRVHAVLRQVPGHTEAAVGFQCLHILNRKVGEEKADQ